MITAEILSVTQDREGLITILTEYKNDGVKLYEECTKHDAFQFEGKSYQDIQDYVLGLLQNRINMEVKQNYLKIANANVADSLKSLVGQIVSGDEVTVSISPTQEITIKQDGTKGQISTRAIG